MKAPDRLALVLLLLFVVALVIVQSQHRFLTAPYENDFPGFAARADSLGAALELNGFYPLGYPLLLWAVRPAVGSIYAAARVVAILSATFLLASAYHLGGMLPDRWHSVLLLAALALNPYMWQGALFLGTDMPWAALQVAALGVAVRAIQQKRAVFWPVAGALTGLAYLVRYTALVTVPVVWLYLAVVAMRAPAERRAALRHAVGYTLAFALLALPQLWISWQATGQPFFNLQGKNVWFGVYGGGDWRVRWNDVSSQISLWQVLWLDPLALLRHWGVELVKGAAYTVVMGSGATLTAYREGSPAARLAWVALATLLGASGLALAWRARLKWREARRAASWREIGLLGGYALGYVASIAIVFVQPRLLLAVLPLALAAVVALVAHAGRAARARAPARWVIVLWLAFAAVNSAVSLRYWLGELQPPVAQVVHALQVAGAMPEERVLSTFEMPYAYHTNYDFRPLATGLMPDDLPAYLESEEARFLLVEEMYGARYWPQLAALLAPNGDQGSPPRGLELTWLQDKPRVVLYRVRTGEQ